MKYFLILLLSALTAFCQPFTMNDTAWMAQQKPAASGGGGPTYVFQENWEGAQTMTGGTGTADNTGWSCSSSSVNVDTSTTGLSLEGTNCMVGGDGEYAHNTFSGSSETWYYLLFRKHVSASSAAKQIVSIRDAGGTSVVDIDVRDATTGTDTLCISVNGGSTASTHTSDVMANDTTYGIWVHILVNGASSTVSAAFSSTTTEPTSGTAFIQITTTLTGNRSQFYFFGWGTTSEYNDKIRVSTTAIGNNPS